ncbi:hypothetical protein ABK905_10430 [Acerihabitans sp. KWT182]|uniref:Uncharacterized protein n=1 Tax=Acerihabitans sp. KWT182 TaxID=3157919 RepID=A0AAU7QDV1_9GAMM
MPDYCFFKKDKQIAVLERSDMGGASRLAQQGYKKQFEEVNATDEKQALARFEDIRMDKLRDHHNFLSGAGVMPLLGVLTAFADFLCRKK